MSDWEGTGTAIGGEATAGMTFGDLRTRMLEKFPADPSADDITQAGRLVNDGYLDFLLASDWSFITATAEVSLTVASLGVVDLPADFASIVADPVLKDVWTGPRLLHRTEEWINEEVKASFDATGTPRYYCVRSKTFVSGTGQRYQIVTYPLPDATYTAVMPYRMDVGPMVDADEYPRGGSMHALTILQAALMIWEQRVGQTDGTERRLYYGTRDTEGQLGMSIRRDLPNRAANLGGERLILTRNLAGPVTWSG